MADEKEPPYFNATVSITPPAGLDPTMVPPYRTVSSRSPNGEKASAPFYQGYSLHFPMAYNMAPPPVYRPSLSSYPPCGTGSIHYPHDYCSDERACELPQNRGKQKLRILISMILCLAIAAIVVSVICWLNSRY